MATQLRGSCHCGAVSYTVQAFAPVPYQICLCSICTKTCGQGGAIYLGGLEDTLKIEGEENISIYRAIAKEDASSDEARHKSERRFCKHCSAMLLLNLRALPGIVLPFASSIDSELLDPAKLQNPQPLTIIHAEHRSRWAHLPEGVKTIYPGFADENLQEWHQRVMPCT